MRLICEVDLGIDDDHAFSLIRESGVKITM